MKGAPLCGVARFGNAVFTSRCAAAAWSHFDARARFRGRSVPEGAPVDGVCVTATAGERLRWGRCGVELLAVSARRLYGATRGLAGLKMERRGAARRGFLGGFPLRRFAPRRSPPFRARHGDSVPICVPAFAKSRLQARSSALAWDARWGTRLRPSGSGASGAEPVPGAGRGQVFCHGNDTLPGPFAFAKKHRPDAWWISEGSFRAGNGRPLCACSGSSADTGRVFGFKLSVRRGAGPRGASAACLRNSKYGRGEIRWHALESDPAGKSFFVNARCRKRRGYRAVDARTFAFSASKVTMRKC